MKGTNGSNAGRGVRKSIAGALVAVALLSGFVAPVSIPNFIPVVALELAKAALALSLFFLAARRRDLLVLLLLSLIPAVSLLEAMRFFPFFYSPDAVLAILLVGHLGELLLLSGLAVVWLNWLGAVPIGLSLGHLMLLFERLRDEPGWLPAIPIIIGILFALMVYFVVRYRTERLNTELQLRQVKTLNRDLSVATAELARYRQRDMLAALAASVAHEINNPANYVSGNLALLEERIGGAPPAGDQERVAELIRSARHGMQTITEVTRRLQGMFRDGASAPEEVNLRELATSALTMLREGSSESVPQTALEIPRELTLSGHPADLHILLANLLRNAFAAAGPAGSVRLYAQEDREAVRIVVEDDGPGIPEEIHGSLFEPFISGRPEGTGIGLALCKTVVEKRGGVIRTERPKGGPTRFLVNIPREEK